MSKRICTATCFVGLLAACGGNRGQQTDGIRVKTARLLKVGESFCFSSYAYTVDNDGHVWLNKDVRAIPANSVSECSELWITRLPSGWRGDFKIPLITEGEYYSSSEIEHSSFTGWEYGYEILTELHGPLGDSNATK